jgi:hypothetical protein
MFKYKYECGKQVVVRFDPRNRIPNIGARKYDGTIHRISYEKNYGAYGTMYELEGCVSDQGVPYTFTKDELEAVK